MESFYMIWILNIINVIHVPSVLPFRIVEIYSRRLQGTEGQHRVLI